MPPRRVLARRKRAAYADEADHWAAAEQTADGEERAVLGDAFARLPERQRFVLFLRYYADLDYGSIADALGISAGTLGYSPLSDCKR